jgi:MFS transporter, PAT family, beta-lactamase induction signal transducer AmpG
MGLALTPDPSAIGTITLTVVIACEHAGAGLGTAVFMVYLMRTCDPAHKAGHFAIVSALMSVSFTLAGVASGFLADAIGFSNYFGFTFLATIPGMVLIVFIPHLDGRETSAAT